jgi:hypothetical protein
MGATLTVLRYHQSQIFSSPSKQKLKRNRPQPKNINQAREGLEPSQNRGRLRSAPPALQPNTRDVSTPPPPSLSSPTPDRVLKKISSPNSRQDSAVGTHTPQLPKRACRPPPQAWPARCAARVLNAHAARGSTRVGTSRPRPICRPPDLDPLQRRLGLQVGRGGRGRFQPCGPAPPWLPAALRSAGAPSSSTTLSPPPPTSSRRLPLFHAQVDLLRALAGPPC